MKKLNITGEGHPFTTQDLIHLQNAYTEVLPGITATQVGKNAIISGLNIRLEGTAYTWTEGYVKYNNEIFKVEAGSLPFSSSNYLYLEIVEGTEKPTNNLVTPYQVFYKGDPTAKNVHLYRKMKPKIGPGNLQLIDYISPSGYYHEIVINKVLNFQYITTHTALQAGNASGIISSDNGLGTVTYRPHPNGYLEVRMGSFIRGSADTRTFWSLDIRVLRIRRFNSTGSLEYPQIFINTNYLMDVNFYTSNINDMKFIGTTPVTLTSYSDAYARNSVSAFSSNNGAMPTQVNTSNHNIEFTNRRDKQLVLTNQVVNFIPFTHLIKADFSNFS